MAPSTSSKPTKSGSHPSALAAITIDLTSPGPSSGLSPQSYDTCDSHGATTTRKKRKVDRACDACRRRKTKCDGPKVQDNICTNCLQANKHCTYLEASKPRGPPKAYVTGLEDRMENLETLLKQLRPDADFASELGPPIIRGSWREQDPSHSYDEQQLFLSSPSSEIAPESKVLPTMSGFSTTGRTTRLMSNPHPTPGRLHQKREEQYHDNTDESDSSEDPSNFDVIEIESISGLVQKLTLQGEAVSTERPSDAHARFHGKSSSVGLIEAAQRFKMMHLLDAIEGGQDTRRESPDSIGDAGFSDRRPEYWTMPRREHQWEELHIDSPELVSSVLAQFPPEDLALELINLYFLHAHCRFPLLHRPTFERHWKENLHHKNTWFTALCLGLFAVASRWSNDVRVVPEGKTTDSGEPDWGLAGPKYFELGSVLHEVRRRLFYPATLFEVQAFAIFALYLRGTPQYPIAWTVVGIATRKLQDVGAHRKKVYHSEPTVDGELWKRAFWCLVVLDRIECASLGRRCSFGQEDFDVDLPLEVDDEYWEMENTALNFTQPKGVPAKIGVFNQIIKLSQVMAFALKTLYAIDKSKIFFGLTPAGWRSEVVQQMDSALKEWTTSLPEHLVWSKQREGSTFAADAATLQTFYHLVQILIYEPLIPSPFSPSSLSESSSPPLPFPALDKCVEAAQACARISETQALQAHLTWPIHIYAAQASSAILLFKIWDTKSQEKAKRAQGVEDTKPPVVQVIEPLMADVRIFVHMLEWAKPRWGLVSPFLQVLRQCLPDVSELSATPLHSESTLRHHSHNKHNEPLASTRSQPRFHSSSRPLHSSHSSQEWKEAHALTRLRPQEQLRSTHSLPSLDFDAFSSHQLPRTVEPREYSGVSPILSKPATTHVGFDGEQDHPTFLDNRVLPSPFHHLKPYYPSGAPVSAFTHPLPNHLDQRSLPYASSATAQVPFPPPCGTDRHRYSHRHRTIADDGGTRRDDINMPFEDRDGRPVINDYPRVSTPAALQNPSETHFGSRPIF